MLHPTLAINPLLEPNPGLMIWTLVVVVVAFVLLVKFAFRPLQNVIERRQQAIASSVDEAERQRTEAQALLSEYREQLSSARREADEIVQRARAAGDELTARVRAESDDARQRALSDTQAQVQAEVERSTSELREQVAAMTVSAAEKVLRGSLDEAAHQRLVEEAVADLDFSQLQRVGAR